MVSGPLVDKTLTCMRKCQRKWCLRVRQVSVGATVCRGAFILITKWQKIAKRKRIKETLREEDWEDGCLWSGD